MFKQRILKQCKSQATLVARHALTIRGLRGLRMTTIWVIMCWSMMICRIKLWGGMRLGKLSQGYVILNFCIFSFLCTSGITKAYFMDEDIVSLAVVCDERSGNKVCIDYEIIDDEQWFWISNDCKNTCKGESDSDFVSQYYFISEQISYPRFGLSLAVDKGGKGYWSQYKLDVTPSIPFMNKLRVDDVEKMSAVSDEYNSVTLINNLKSLDFNYEKLNRVKMLLEPRIPWVEILVSVIASPASITLGYYIYNQCCPCYGSI